MMPVTPIRIWVEDPMDELASQLIERARAGDESAAPFLVSLYGERLLGYARAIAPDLSDLDRELIVERAVESGVRALSAFDETKGTLFAWFRRQIQYKTLDWRKAHPAEGEVPASYVAPTSDQPSHGVEVFEALSRILQQLSHDDQKIIALRDTEGLAYEEISTRLGVSTDALRQRHSRAVKRLHNYAKKDALLSVFLTEGSPSEQRT